MKKIFLYATIFVLFFLSISCEKNNITNQSDNEYVNRWIYENMSVYYLWNDKLPVLAPAQYEVNPDIFFDKILYKYDAQSNPDGDRFSWIQDNYVELLNSLSGVSSYDIGFEYQPYYIVNGNPEVEMRITYTKRGSDAETKGVKRGHCIRAVNGITITDKNYRDIFSGSSDKRLSRVRYVQNPETGELTLEELDDVTVKMNSQFAENPVYLDSIYTFDNKKIGYLVYNFFSHDKGDNSYEYDLQLMQVLAEMKSKGVTEMILDLRYNSGGAVSSAVALASVLVKNHSTNNVMARAKYNVLLEESLRKEYGDDFFYTYFQSKIVKKDGATIEIPLLNLSNLYVITGKRTASASELIINGLKPYMDNIILIGDKTVGKNVGSISIYNEKDERNKWGMQPIVVKYLNSLGYSDYTSGFSPNPDNFINEFNYELVELGNTNDPLLNRAIELITGNRNLLEKPIKTTKYTLPLAKPKGLEQFNMRDDIHEKALLDLMKK